MNDDLAKKTGASSALMSMELRSKMSGEKKSKGTGEVLRVYVAYWLVCGFFVGSLASPEILRALTLYLSIPVCATFLVVYDCKERIKAYPVRFIFVFQILMALMLVPLKAPLGSSFNYVCIVALCGMSVAFAYTYFIRERISESPWKFLMPFVFLFLSMTVALGVVG